LRLVRGDITDQSVEAVVNAANPGLMGGGGVDGAIHRRGGPSIRRECEEIRKTRYPAGLPVGRAVITSGGNLEADYVIHTVGPIWRGGQREEPELLSEAYRNCLRLAAERGLKTIAFPSISTGAYRYPIREASRIALRTIKEFLEGDGDFEEVSLVLFSDNDLEVYEEAMSELIGT